MFISTAKAQKLFMILILILLPGIFSLMWKVISLFNLSLLSLIVYNKILLTYWVSLTAKSSKLLSSKSKKTSNMFSR